jgi:hypothetical protein
MTAQEVFDGITGHMDSKGKPYSAWYAGIASDARTRLFVDHNVSEPKGEWAYYTCANNQDARTVEEALLKLGCDGGPGGGDKASTQVYAYVKTSTTRQ